MKRLRRICWKYLYRHIFVLVDLIFMKVDRKLIATPLFSSEAREDLKIMKLVPSFLKRSGGARSVISYAESIGVFKVLINGLVKDVVRPKILDIGCGTGLLAIASESLVKDGGEYIGLDVKEEDIRYCRKHFEKIPSLSFIYHPVRNATYAPHQDSKHQPWDILDESIDLVVSKSIWTHLNEQDAIYYFGEVGRVLKSGGKALITFCLLDEDYYRQASTINKPWFNYNKPIYNSQNWITMSNIKVPENFIAITTDGIQKMADLAGLTLVKKYPGQWKRKPGFWDQDILTFEKKSKFISN